MTCRMMTSQTLSEKKKKRDCDFQKNYSSIIDIVNVTDILWFCVPRDVRDTLKYLQIKGENTPKIGIISRNVKEVSRNII